jgi:hypothetical protein
MTMMQKPGAGTPAFGPQILSDQQAGKLAEDIPKTC